MYSFDQICTKMYKNSLDLTKFVEKCTNLYKNVQILTRFSTICFKMYKFVQIGMVLNRFVQKITQIFTRFDKIC